MENPTFIKGDIFEDHRGKLSFVNDFILTDVRRMYLIEHSNNIVIRAWQGHKVERKWFYVIEGGFELHLVRPNDWFNPAKDLPVLSFKLDSSYNGILYVPGGFANGFRAMKEHSKMLVFSDFDINQSLKDEYRFDKDLWYKW